MEISVKIDPVCLSNIFILPEDSLMPDGRKGPSLLRTAKDVVWEL